MPKRRPTRPGKTRHGEIRLDRYKRIHNRVMRNFLQGGFVVYDGVTFGEPKGGYITMQGQIQCLGGINIDVDKKLRIVGGTGGNTRVKTSEYSYNVSVSGRGNRFRYDSAHITARIITYIDSIRRAE